MGHLNDRWNVKFDGVMVKDMTVKQIIEWLGKDLSQFDDEVLQTELAGRYADTQDTRSPYYRGNRLSIDPKEYGYPSGSWQALVCRLAEKTSFLACRIWYLPYRIFTALR